MLCIDPFIIGDEFLDDLNWQAEKKPITDNEGIDTKHITVLDKLQETATKSLGHYQRSETASVTASDRLLKELRAVYKSEVVKQGKMTVEPIEDNIYELKVVMYSFDPDSALAKDLEVVSEEKGEQIGVELRFHFSPDYPFDPPFVRVVSPFLIGGYVFSGGAICMELLTKDGWSPSYTIETVCLQLSATIVRGKGRVFSEHEKEADDDLTAEEKAILEAFKDKKGSRPQYSFESARRNFKHIERSHQKHGWNPNPKS
jgi:ubiquitin-conjugating enzyme E2 Q